MRFNIKTKIRIVLVVLIPMLISSCSDWLELVPPDGLVRDEYWKSKEDVEASLMGAYQKFAKLDATLFLMGELRGDLIISDINTPPDYRDVMEANIFLILSPAKRIRASLITVIPNKNNPNAPSNCKISVNP